MRCLQPTSGGKEESYKESYSADPRSASGFGEMLAKHYLQCPNNGENDPETENRPRRHPKAEAELQRTKAQAAEWTQEVWLEDKKAK